jgi:hypothetical protein
MKPARDETEVRGTNGNGQFPPEAMTPWVSAEEMQPLQRPQSCCPLDEIDEALLESFPCSDPPCYSHAHA